MPEYYVLTDCPDCRGTGAWGGESTCPQCDGEGEVRVPLTEALLEVWSPLPRGEDDA